MRVFKSLREFENRVQCLVHQGAVIKWAHDLLGRLLPIKLLLKLK